MLSAVALLAVGCGSGEASKSAPAIIKDAQAAATAATSVHVHGAVSVQGQAAPVDLRIATNGAIGTATFGGASVSLIRVDGNLYVKGAQQLFGSFLGASAAAKAGDHWVQISTSLPQLAQLANLTAMNQLVPQLLTPSVTAAKHGMRTISGSSTIVVSGFGTDGTGSLFVAASGRNYPVQLSIGNATLSFSDWGKPVSVAAPTDVVPLTALTG